MRTSDTVQQEYTNILGNIGDAFMQQRQLGQRIESMELKAFQLKNEFMALSEKEQDEQEKTDEQEPDTAA